MEKRTEFGQKSKNTIKDKANRNEKKLAKELGGHRQPNSGAIPCFKGDIVTTNYLYDDKSTKHMSISLKYEDLQKIAKEALGSDKEPVLILTFDSVKRGTKNFAVIELELWKKLSGDNDG